MSRKMKSPALAATNCEAKKKHTTNMVSNRGTIVKCHRCGKVIDIRQTQKIYTSFMLLANHSEPRLVCKDDRRCFYASNIL